MNDLVKSMPDNPVIVLTDEKKYSEFYERIAEEVRAHVPDVSTAAGRGEIKSLAYKVTRTKTAIDEAGKKLNEEAREKINAVDAQRRKIRKELDELADEIRKPVTDWEAAEDARKEKADATLFAIIKATVDANEAQAIGDTKRSDILRGIFASLEAVEVDPEIMADRLGEAIDAKSSALMKIATQVDRSLKEEADAEELRRLREEAIARDAREAEERAARAAAEAERIAKENAAKEEAERIKREQIEAEQRAERERQQRQEEIDAARREEIRKAEEAIAAAEAKRKAEREEELRAAQAAIDAAKAEADARVAEAERRQREQEAAIAEAKAKEDRERIEAQRREKDRQHRGVILKAAKEAIMVHGGVDEPTAKKIVLAIGANEIPNVRIEF